MLRRGTFLAGATTVALYLAAMVAPAGAESAPANPQPSPAMLEALQRDLGLTAEQAIQRLANEARAASAESALTTTLGEKFAGAWLNGDASQLSVATTDAAAADAIRAKGAQPVVVGRTLGELNALKDRLDQAPAQAKAGASVWYVDVTTNSVTVLTKNQAAGEALVAAAGVDKNAVRVAVSAEEPRAFINIVGGNAFYIGSSRCSIGFSVRKGTTPGFVTAGHCGRAGATTSSPSGTFQGSSFPGNDYAWVATPGHTPTPYVRGSGGANVTVRGSTQATVGASICRSGSTTGWRCGTIQQHNASVTYPQGTVSGLTRTSACAQPGDSGGSFISGSQAQGVTSGGSGNCSVGGTTYHQPVNEILSTYGLTLVTG
ncbi:streptogrisin C [Streptosporangium becharense]|uniref:Streptogrisin C n=1 Tax=Streptosporangium becharense TaxID=1816182 RepID=A0A7W9MEX1_9ACTN|nr:S1 family peptidase [Streptosporangium becharense]MBB2913703.1 streptogrisin C [Streptosporangium becharense]MBB5817784.1 streptogrisin C [Streptosporangium becharense]